MEVKATIKNGIMTIQIPVNKSLEPSSSGKILSVGSTHGFKRTDSKVEGKDVWVSVNAFVYPERR